MDNESSGWQPRPKSASSAGERNCVEQVYVLIPATVSAAIVVPFAPSSARMRLSCTSEYMTASVNLFTSIFSLSVVITILSAASATLNSGGTFQGFETTSDVFEGNAARAVYFTSIMSLLQTITFIDPLSRTKVTPFASLVKETTEALAVLISVREMIITALKKILTFA